MGALARLWAITGREMTALVVDRRLARAFAEAFAEQDVSWPLAEVFRLSGVLHDRVAFEDADDLREQVADRGRASAARGAARRAGAGARTGDARAPGRSGARPAARADAGLGCPAHVRWSASRWFVRALRERRHDDSAARTLARFEQETRGRSRRASHGGTLSRARAPRRRAGGR